MEREKRCFENHWYNSKHISFLMVFLGFLQAYNQWGERTILSLFFLVLGIILFVLSVFGVIVYKNEQRNPNTR